jgi:glycerol-1-phosphate dehydrogenase [NAD(P)+]
MQPQILYQIVPDAVPALLAYCQEHALQRFFLVADENTYRVLGERVEAALKANGLDVKTILLTGPHISTNEHFIVRTMLETNGESRTYLAVGSGTITDITRFVSHRAHDSFLSLPTAPSVDGFTSVVAPTAVGSYKYPVPAQPPDAVFAELPVLCAAPQPLIAAGFGDLLGKFTSLADWRLGALLYDEPYDAHVYQQMLDEVEETTAAVDAVASHSEQGIRRLMDGLIGCGFGMLAFGESRPASGSEHHLGHYWEGKLIMEGRPAVLHGAEVGVATVFSTRRYALLRGISREKASQLLEQRGTPTREMMLEEIQAGYGPIAGHIAQIQSPLLAMTAPDIMDLKARILNHWDAVQAIADTVPTPDQIVSWLSAVNGPITPSEIGLSPEETILGLQSAHYLRDRFTLHRLAFWLNLPTGYP